MNVFCTGSSVTSSKYVLLPPPSRKFLGEVEGLVTNHLPFGRPVGFFIELNPFFAVRAKNHRA